MRSILNRFFISVLFSTLPWIGTEKIFAQTTKGFATTKPEGKKAEGKTYALIIGISKYKDAGIPVLEYADKDAEAFRDYLLMTGVDSDRVSLLLNNQATTGEFWAFIFYYSELVKAGDKLIIYFSGHGDVESQVITHDAYLLTYESPSSFYIRNSISVYHLQGYLETFASKGVQIIFIGDACHSGNLAGGREGKNAIASALKETWKDEIKILSCQPGELSLEGKQWGGGRGLFSFHLTNALAGLGDLNQDGIVSLGELNRYLISKIPDEARPVSQFPEVKGDMNTNMATVNEKTLAMAHSSSTLNTSVSWRGIEENLLKYLSDSVKRNYALYKMYLDSGIIVRYNGNHWKSSLAPSAAYYYERIPKTESTMQLIQIIQRNLGSRIMDQFNANLIEWAYGKEFYEMNFAGILKKNDAQILDARRSILFLEKIYDDEKLKSVGFLAKKYFVESRGYWNYGKRRRTINKAIDLEPNATYLYFARAHDWMNAGGNMHAIEIEHRSKVIADLKTCIQQRPNWTGIYAMIAAEYKNKKNYDSAFAYCYKAIQLDSTMTGPYVTIGKIYEKRKKYDEAEKYYLKAKELDNNNYFIIARIAAVNIRQNKYENALKYFEQGLEGEIDHNNSFHTYFIHYTIKKEKAFKLIRKTPAYIAIMKKYFPDQYKEK